MSKTKSQTKRKLLDTTKNKVKKLPNKKLPNNQKEVLSLPEKSGVIQKGLKVNTGQNLDSIKKGEKTHTKDYKELAKNKSLIGAKTQNYDSPSLRELRKRFGFNWRKLAQKLGLFAFIFGILLIIAGSFGTAWAINQYNGAPSVKDLLANPPESSVIYASDGETVIFELFDSDSRRDVVEACTDQLIEDNKNCIPENMQMAIIALEDENFYKTGDTGISWRNIAGALVECVTSFGNSCRGASGLSQQMVKIATEQQDNRTLAVKIQELFTAMKLNEEIPDRQERIEIYLNLVPFGRNSQGIQSASQAYFEKDVKDLNTLEACSLAALPQRPGSFSGAINNLSDKEEAIWQVYDARVDICIQKLNELDLKGDGKRVIETVEEKEKWQATDFTLAKNDDEIKNTREAGNIAFVPFVVDDPVPHFRAYVVNELKKIIPEEDLYQKGYQITTTIDLEMQRDVEQILRDNKDRYLNPNGAQNAAATILDQETGEIRVMVGSLDFNDKSIDGQVNLVTSPTQPGSSTKPYVAANFFENGFNPGTTVVDIPTNFGNYTPKNFSGTTLGGPINVRNAVQRSLNIPLVKIICLSNETRNPDCAGGTADYIDFARRIGLEFGCFETDGVDCSDPVQARQAVDRRCGGPSTALGGCEIIPLSHATALNTIKNEGDLRTAVPFKSIKGPDGDEVFTEKIRQRYYPRQDEAIDPGVAKQTTNVISDYRARRPIFGRLSSFLELDECRTTAKTGTSNNVRAAWAVGGCSKFTIVVFARNSDNSPLNQRSSASAFVAPIFKQINEYTLKYGVPEEFDFSGLEKVSLSPTTGFRVSSGGYTELLTPEQRAKLNSGADAVANPESNYQDSNIFTYRSAAVEKKILINKLDGLRATDLTLESNIEEINCIELLGEFPNSSAWNNPIQRIRERNSDRYCPALEDSPQDQVNQQDPININSSLESGDSVSNLSFTADINSQDKTIQELEILVNSESKALKIINSNSGSISLDVSNQVSNNNTITFRAKDSFGTVYQLEFNNINFVVTNTELTTGDLNDITYNCTSVTAGTDTSCSFSLPSGKSLNSNFRIRIASLPFSDNCSTSGSLVSCSQVSTPLGAGTYNIFVSIGGGFINSGESVVIT